MSTNSLVQTIDEEIEKTERIISENIETSNQSITFKEELEEYLMLETRLMNYIMTLSIGGNGQSTLNQNQIRSYNNYDQKKAKKTIRKKLNEKFIEKDKKRAEYLYILNSIFYNQVIKEFNPDEVIMSESQNCNEDVKRSFIFYDKICKFELDKIDKLLLQIFNDEIQKNNKDSKIKINKFPDFILYDFHELIKQKIFSQWSINYKILLKDLILSDKAKTFSMI